jgi:ADP-ribose pyrophosphatase YjhB (NUDIX family)
MNFEPQKFFVGLMEFFSILLPGALLTYLLKDDLGRRFLGQSNYDKLGGAEGWVVFLFSSYLLGHFLFLIGSLLDDYVYDPIRKATERKQFESLSSGGTLSPLLARCLAGAFFKKNVEDAVEKVVVIKEDYLKRIKAANAVNAFQWCKARLAIERPETLATVHRFEADSKFFRSFIALLVGFLVAALYHRQWELAGISAVLLALGFWRYMEQRFKSTQQAYWTILTLEAGKQPQLSSTLDTPSSLNSNQKSTGPSHAGGVVSRKKAGGRRYLLVQAKRDPNQWVLPKGHIERDENAKYTAVREVKEETGVWARIKDELKTSDYTVEGKSVSVCFFLMEAVAKGKRKDRKRKHKWLSLERALRQATHEESKELLRLGERKQTQPITSSPITTMISS